MCHASCVCLYQLYAFVCFENNNPDFYDLLIVLPELVNCVSFFQIEGDGGGWLWLQPVCCFWQWWESIDVVVKFLLKLFEITNVRKLECWMCVIWLVFFLCPWKPIKNRYPSQKGRWLIAEIYKWIHVCIIQGNLVWCLLLLRLKWGGAYVKYIEI